MRSGARPADRIALVEEFDNFAGLRHGIAAVAAEKSEWAGIPMPIEGERLVIEPSDQFAEALMGMGTAVGKSEDPSKPPYKVRNEWYSKRWRGRIVVYEDENGRVHRACIASKLIDHEIQTIGASFAWGVAQEHHALNLLASLVTHVAFKQYLLTGTFIETSKRTGIFYVFRKLRPTVALRADGETLRVLCAMCMHPIGYYAGSWGGAMCPTDDVIAHLMLMRGDEPMFWRRANQHSAYMPESGL